MLLHQYVLGFVFYLVYSLFACLGLALLLRVINNSVTAYGCAKLVGLSVFGYVIWLLASLRLFNFQWIWLITALFLASMLGALWSSRKQFAELPWKKILWMEMVSLALYFAYLYIRSYNPQIYGTEKFMDMAMFSASGKTNFFPFADPWYAGKTVNYYYYGHYLMSLLANLSRIPYALAYNYALALLFCQSLIISFAVAWPMTKSKFFAVLAAFLIVLSGSMFYAGCELHTFFTTGGACSYASSTRLYTPSYIINEIPSYSFTVGDLHAHMIALPFFLINLLLILAFLEGPKNNKLFFGLLVVQLVTSALINTTDVVSLHLLLGLAFAYQIYVFWRGGQTKKIIDLLWFGVTLVALELLLYWPFLHSFHNPTLGVGVAFLYAKSHNLLFNGNQYPTPLLALAGMWGVFVVTCVYVVWKKRFLAEALTPALLTAASLLLIIGVELFFIKDIYSVANPPYFRANTVFKFGYHTWTMLCLAFSACVAKLYKKTKHKYFLNAGLAVFIFLGAIYPFQAVKQFFLSQPVQAKTLDGSQFLNGQSTGDYQTVQWINANVPGRPVIAEAVGDSYSYYARISVFTGDINPMGWKTHEWTWRFDGSTLAEQEKVNPNGPFETGYGPIAAVAQDIQTLYETPDLPTTKLLINKYHIQYIYVGNLERTTYKQLNEQNFYQLGTVVFSYGSSQLFKVN